MRCRDFDNSHEWYFQNLKSADHLYFQSLLFIYIFKIHYHLHFQSQLIIYTFQVCWLFIFLSKSADYLHFFSQLIVYIFRVSWWHEVKYFWINLVEINIILKYEWNSCFCQDFGVMEKEGRKEGRRISILRSAIAAHRT